MLLTAVRASSIAVELHTIGSIRRQKVLMDAYDDAKLAYTRHMNPLRSVASDVQMDGFDVIMKEAKSRVFSNVMQKQSRGGRTNRGGHHGGRGRRNN